MFVESVSRSLNRVENTGLVAHGNESQQIIFIKDEKTPTERLHQSVIIIFGKNFFFSIFGVHIFEIFLILKNNKFNKKNPEI